ncbi:MAG: DUF2156 domain-containing protein [Synergistaceae bacterium]|nr:DUF2156 domain-containing protein [Synergistaceae bacterium]
MLNFKELKWQDKEIYIQCYKESPVHYAEYSFLNLWAWRHAYPVEFAITDENLCWLMSGGPLPGIFGPIGDWNAVQDWDKELKNFNIGDVIYDVPEEVKNILESRNNLRFSEDRDQHEYVYSVKDLTALKGKAFAHKRNRVRAFLDGYEWDYYKMSPDFFDEVIDFQERWRLHRDETMNEEEIKSLYNEDIAIRSVLDKWSDFNLIGGVLKVNEKIIAYTIGAELDEKNIDVMFEKAFPEYTGSYQAINYLFQKNQCSEYEWANREEDMGEPGLREAKMSYNPAKMLKKYIMEIL